MLNKEVIALTKKPKSRYNEVCYSEYILQREDKNSTKKKRLDLVQ